MMSPRTEQHCSIDAHILIWSENHLVGHEYILKVEPCDCGRRIDDLENAHFHLDVTFEFGGRMEDVAVVVPMVSGCPSHRYESTDQWIQREPTTVNKLIGNAAEEWEALCDEELQLLKVACESLKAAPLGEE